MHGVTLEHKRPSCLRRQENLHELKFVLHRVNGWK
jgi:hypothetical protein